MAIGLLLVRVVVGLLFIGHGTQKLFGWFGGYGVEGTSGFMSSLGYRGKKAPALLAGFGEAGGGLLLALGFLTPLAAAAIIGVMVNAIVSVHAKNGVWNTENGVELPLVYATVAASLAFAGAGAFSLDRLAGWHLNGVAYGLGTLALGLAAGAAVLVFRRAAPAAESSEETEQRAA